MSHPDNFARPAPLRYDIHETPPLPELIILAIQHVFAMFGATVLVPILVNGAVGETVIAISVALFTSGIGTLIYQFCTKRKSPVYLGSSFAFIAPVTNAYLKGGIAGAMTGMMLVGLIYCVCSLLVHLAGTSWLHRLLPPVVVGPMIMVIGLSLAPSAVGQIGLSGENPDWRNLVVAAIACLSTVLISIAARGFLKVIPVLCGILIGYVSALVLGLVDLQPFLEAPWLQLPAFHLPFVSYQLDFGSALTMAPIAIVTMAEHVGDHTVLSRSTNKDLLTDPGLDRTLAGDGLATFVAGLLGGPANTTYGENTAVVGMTRVASVNVVTLAACFAMGLAFIGKFTALVSTIPNAVLGGVSLILYGYIANNGLKELIKNQTDLDDMRNNAIVSIMLVLGLGGAVLSIALGKISISFTGMSLAAIFGVLLNLFLPYDRSRS